MDNDEGRLNEFIPTDDLMWDICELLNKYTTEHHLSLSQKVGVLESVKMLALEKWFEQHKITLDKDGYNIE